jgi:anaerobic selenocysteine-containing dehydrogenase
MVQVVFSEGLAKLDRVSKFTDGVEVLRECCAPFTPERVSGAAGMTAETIRGLARTLAKAERAVAYGRIGVSTQEFGALSCWLINVLNVITGHLDLPGGAMFTGPAVDLIRGGGMYGGAGRFGRWKSRVRALPEFAGELPVAALAEEIDTPGDGQVRGLVTHAGNPVLSTPNGARLDGALPALEFYAAIDFYINETTRHAHVILPPTAGLERDHYDLVFHTLAIRNTAKWSPAVVDAAPGARHDWQILNELTWRLARGGPLRRARAWGAAMLVKRFGVRGMMRRALAGSRYGAAVSLDALERAPHGVDLGPLTSMLPERLRTENKRIALAPASMLADVPRLSAMLDRPSAAPDELLLIGRRDLRSNNSWMANSERLVRGQKRCALLMHPADAAARGLTDSAMARVVSRVGAIEVELETTDAMMPGVVCLPHGWGHDREGVRLRTARAHGGASHNDLTDDARVDAFSGNAAFCGTPVRVGAA